MKIQHNISLKNYNTFGVDVKARRFVTIEHFHELKELLKTEKDIFLISGGSNLLLTKDIEKLVVHINIKGISIDREDENHIYLTVNAGENWHDFVLWCVDHEYGGLENLSLIPGAVGTCPIQNIGAYGVEVKDCITSVHTLEIATGTPKVFFNDECKFGYRNSIFKNEAKGKYIITSVGFCLTKQNHKLNTSYGTIENELTKKGIKTPTLKTISESVIAIRSSKLPDPKKIGNSGSFFKNPTISDKDFQQLKQQYPDIPNYPVDDKMVKIPAGWLIEKAGFKGKRFGNGTHGVHKNQALVLVNYGNARGEDIHKMAKKIQTTIKSMFGIHLEIEVNVV